MDKTPEEEYFEMVTANTKLTRPHVCADECLALMRDYASEVTRKKAIDCTMRYYQYSALNQEKNEDVLREHITAFYDKFIETQPVSKVEKYWEKTGRLKMKDKYDKSAKHFDYYDMIDFAEQYAKKIAKEQKNNE